MKTNELSELINKLILERRMKASEIKPQSGLYGNAMSFQRKILMRRWDSILRNAKHMEETLLALMANPETTPEQLSQAAKLYASVTKTLHETANKIDENIYNEGKPKDVSCVFCGSTEPLVEGEGAYPYCPSCKGV